jgi:hypothetical protein
MKFTLLYLASSPLEQLRSLPVGKSPAFAVVYLPRFRSSEPGDCWQHPACAP